MRKEVLLVAGTRPEAVKIAPVAIALRGHPGLRPTIVHSGQHSGMVEQALGAFDLVPDVRLDVPRTTGTQAELVSRLLPEFDAVLEERDPRSPSCRATPPRAWPRRSPPSGAESPWHTSKPVCAPATCTARSPRRGTGR